MINVGGRLKWGEGRNGPLFKVCIVSFYYSCFKKYLIYELDHFFLSLSLTSMKSICSLLSRTVSGVDGDGSFSQMVEEWMHALMLVSHVSDSDLVL